VATGGQIHFNLDQLSIPRALLADPHGDPFDVG